MKPFAVLFMHFQASDPKNTVQWAYLDESPLGLRGFVTSYSLFRLAQLRKSSFGGMKQDTSFNPGVRSNRKDCERNEGLHHITQKCIIRAHVYTYLYYPVSLFEWFL